MEAGPWLEVKSKKKISSLELGCMVSCLVDVADGFDNRRVLN